MNFALCIEASHKKGLGHLFRMFNFIEHLKEQAHEYFVFINDDERVASLLNEKGIEFKTVELNDFSSDWETTLIKQHKIDIWLNDRLNTEKKHSENVVKNNVKLITFDDRGSGAELADINFVSLAFSDSEILKGKRVKTGIEYLILNKEIDKYKRIRTKLDKILVTLGGSDTYGATLKVAEILKTQDKKATIVVGPAFQHRKELDVINDGRFTIKSGVPSLIQEFSNYDIAITGGGITPFEANASGLPCIIVANEIHEIDNANLLVNLGASIFCGYHENIDIELFNMDFNIEQMSRSGLEKVQTLGTENIYKEIMRKS